MRKAVWCSALTGTLLLTTAIYAQEPNLKQSEQQSPPAQQQETVGVRAPDHTNPGTGRAQPQAPLADQAAPADVGPAQANTANTGDSSGWPIGSTPQTAPSTKSANNAKLDKLPIVAYQLPLNDEQKKLIAQSVAQAPKSPDADKLGNISVWNFVPQDVNVQGTEFSAEVKQQVPGVGRYRFVKSDKRVLIIDPTNEVIVGEVPL